MNSAVVRAKIFMLVSEYIELANSNSVLLKEVEKNNDKAEKITDKIAALEEQYISALTVEDSNSIPLGTIAEGLSENGIYVPSEIADDFKPIKGAKLKVITKAWKYFIEGG